MCLLTVIAHPRFVLLAVLDVGPNIITVFWKDYAEKASSVRLCIQDTDLGGIHVFLQADVDTTLTF